MMQLEAPGVYHGRMYPNLALPQPIRPVRASLAPYEQSPAHSPNLEAISVCEGSRSPGSSFRAEIIADM